MNYAKTVIAALLFLGLSAHAQESSEPSAKVQVSTGKYVTGGVLASVFGFGIGHAVQGRYSDRGYIFTATEVAAVATMALGLGSCSKSKDSYGVETTSCSNGGLITLGFGALLGFRIWEIVDSWVGATPVDKEGPHAFFIPDPKSPAFGVAFNF